MSSNISLVLSGGSNNLNPNLSLGGNPSYFHVASGNINNLFADISPEEATTGKTDYRCLYLFNDSNAYVFNIKLWMESETTGGSNISLGLFQANEIQRISISRPVTSGYFSLLYEGNTITSTYNNDLGIWATELQHSLSVVADEHGNQILSGVLVNAQMTNTTIIFDVLFADQSGSRNHDTFLVTANTLGTDISVSTIQQGAPVNTIAPSLDTDTTPPGGVSFLVPTQLSPLSVPNLGSAEGFPIWFQRITNPDTDPLADDGFNLKIQAQTYS